MSRLIAAAIAGALANWLVLFRFLTYQQRNRMPMSTWVIFSGICLLAGFGLTFGMTDGRKKVIHVFLAGVIGAHFVVLQLDWMKDPTDHNLFPFELVFLAIMSSPAYLGALLSRAFPAKSDGEPQK